MVWWYGVGGIVIVVWLDMYSGRMDDGVVGVVV